MNEIAKIRNSKYNLTLIFCPVSILAQIRHNWMRMHGLASLLHLRVVICHHLWIVICFVHELHWLHFCCERLPFQLHECQQNVASLCSDEPFHCNELHLLRIHLKYLNNLEERLVPVLNPGQYIQCL